LELLVQSGFGHVHGAQNNSVKTRGSPRGEGELQIVESYNTTPQCLQKKTTSGKED